MQTPVVHLFEYHTAWMTLDHSKGISIWQMQVRLRKLMIDMVLGTDMKQHCTIISRFQTVLQVKLHSHQMTTAGATPAAADGQAIKFEDPADRSMLLQVLQLFEQSMTQCRLYYC